jgi:hypothetical protein
LVWPNFSKLRPMKRRLLYLAPILLIFFSIGVGLVPPAPVAAGTSGPEYVMNFDPAQKAAIESCLNNHNCDRSNQTSDIYNIALFAKGGVYGSSPIQLNYEPNEITQGTPPASLRSDEFAFTGNYSCQNFSISLLMTVDLGDLGSNSYPAKVYLDNVRNTTTGIDTSYTTAGADWPLSLFNIQTQAGLPQSCWPPNLNTPNQSDFSGTKTVPLANFTKLSSAQKTAWGAAVASPTFASGTGGGNSPSLSCDFGISGPFDLSGILSSFNPLNWLVCGIIKGMDLIVKGVDSQITSMLAIGTTGTTSDNPTNIFADSSGNCTAHFNNNTQSACTSYYTAWQSFRDIALGLLVIIGLIIVSSQALGMEILDAYTIRKMLPRVLIAAIGITLSWQLMRFLVILSNDLGYGVESLLYSPFHGISDTINSGGFANQLLGGLAAAIGLATLGFFGLLTFAGTAAIAVFVAILVLILRQIAIIMLVIFSPIALIAYVLPNTQRVYKFWWESFSKMLLMFPMIVGMITIGHIFSAISSQNPGFINQVIAFIAYFAPYFMIPATFRFSGGIMSTVGGAINGRADGARGYLRKKRGEKVTQNMADLASGNRLKGENIKTLGYGRFAKRFNSTSRGVALIPKAGQNPFRMRQRLRSAESTHSTDLAMDALQNNNNVRAMMGDDDLVEVALLQHNDADRESALIRRGLTPERATQGVAAIRAAERSMDSVSFEKAMLVASAGTSSGWTPKYDESGRLLNPDSAGGAGQLRKLINDRMGNDRQGAIAVLGAVRQQAESKGRFDLVGGSFTEDAQLMEQNNALAKDGGQVDVANWTKQIHRNALDGQSRGRILSGHNRSLQALAPEMLESLNDVDGGRLVNGEKDPEWTPSKAIEQYAFLASTLDSSASASPEMARHIRNQLNETVDLSRMDGRMAQILHQKGVRVYNDDGHVRTDLKHDDIMKVLRSDPEFGRYRREWGSTGEAEAALRGGARPPDQPPEPPAPPGGGQPKT